MFSSKKSKVWLLSLLGFFLVVGGAFLIYQNRFSGKADEVIKPSAESNKITNKFLPVENQLLVKFKTTTDKEKKEKFYAKHGAKEKSEITQLGVKIITLSANDPEQKAKEIRQSDADTIEYIEPDYQAEPVVVPNDQYYTSNQASWFNIANAPAGWDISQGDNVIIGMADSGIDPTHPDLKDKLLAGWNFYDGNSNTADVSGHGTSTAGAASATSNNTIGVSGSSLNSKILPIRITGLDGYTTYSAIGSAISYAADHGASVVSVSFGGPSPSVTLQGAVDYAVSKKVVVVAAAGNNGSEVANYPASSNGVISVSALEPASSFSSLAGYSSYSNYIDVSSAGCLYTTANGGGYRDFCGTSNATPVVTGLVALIKSINPNLTVQQVTDYVTQNANDLGDLGWDKYYGWGRIDYQKTLAAVKSTVLPAPVKGTITGKITDTANIPISGATVSALQSGLVILSTQTLADGSYVMSLDPGTYTFKAEAPNYTSTTTSSQTVSSGVTNFVNISLTIMPAADTTAPTVSINQPSGGASVKIGSKTTITATAKDNLAVTKVEFYVDGKLIATDTSSPYSVSWSVNRKNTIGAHNITAKAYDAAGNTNSSTISVNFIK
ncbi:MAG: S8 family serine peptidase [Patescibacteria group bacterium]|nr:S8 family serine peptidase [Patescibacteria group bacterium]